jgi:hypothetical protein
MPPLAPDEDPPVADELPSEDPPVEALLIVLEPAVAECPPTEGAVEPASACIKVAE